MDRREFLKLTAVASVSATGITARSAEASTDSEERLEFVGMLIDTTRCIGCQACEVACAKENGLPFPEIGDQPPGENRPTKTDQYTIVNQFNTEQGPVWVKTACNHCSQPACATACLVNAMEKTPEGPVIWHPDRCMGCRYCMIACPFDVPKFEYDKAIPVISKCNMCYERSREGRAPACAEACPQNAIVFGTRRELMEEAWRRITSDPDKYSHHIYGNREVGGTEIMYLASGSFEELGFRTDLGSRPYSEYTREFLYAVPLVLTILPVFLFGISAGVTPEENGGE